MVLFLMPGKLYFSQNGGIMNLSVNFAGIEMKNPVTTASGTFGSGAEYKDYVDLNKLGAVTTKGVSSVPWQGNPVPRICETYGGMLNAIGLQNPGIDLFIERDLPFLKQYDTRIIVNVCGRTVEEYEEVAERLANTDADMLEINISCPNVEAGGIAFGQDPELARQVTDRIKQKLPAIREAIAAAGLETGSLTSHLAGGRSVHHTTSLPLAETGQEMEAGAATQSRSAQTKQLYQAAKAVIDIISR